MNLSLFSVLVLFLSLTDADVQRKCYKEIKESCASEIFESARVSSNSSKSRYPPTADVLKTYHKSAQIALDCALQVNCSKSYSKNEINEKVNIPLGSQNYRFDKECMNEVLTVLHNTTESCASGFDFRMLNGSLNSEVFTNSKDCILSIANGTCSTDDFNFLRNQYDELLAMYTKKPDSGNTLCNTPYHKFYINNCERTPFRLENYLNRLTLLNHTDADIDLFLQEYKDLQKCKNESCMMFEGLEKMFDYVKNFGTDIKLALAARSTALKYKCLKDNSLYVFFNRYYDCKRRDEQTVNCISFEIDKICKNETVHVSEIVESTTVKSPSSSP